MSKLELHPLCTLFPRMEGAEFKSLCDDILANGLRQPIVRHEGMILDGGNRYRACREVGVEPKFTDFKNGNIVSFVLSANLHRRHMTAGQQAAIVASAQDWGNAHGQGGDRKSDQSATLHLDSVTKRAAESGASVRTQKMADKVAKKSPALAKRVAHGEISLPKAHKQVSETLPKILPRRESKAALVAKKLDVADPLEKAREHAKKQNAVIRQLRADLAERDARIEALTAELQASRDNARELADSLEAYTVAEKGVKESAAEIKILYGKLHVVESTRDQYMTTCNELKRTVKAQQRKLEKAA